MGGSGSTWMKHKATLILHNASIRKLFFYAVILTAAVLILLSQNTTPKSKVRRRYHGRRRSPLRLPKVSSIIDDCIRTLEKQNITPSNHSHQQRPLTQDPRTVKSWQELRNIVSNLLDIDTTIAIRRSNITLEDDFPQNFWPPGVALTGCLRKLYDDMFYTVRQQTSCALVGNGGILKNSNCGKRIDSHDFVMRVNLAEITGFEEDVGGRTDLTAINTAVGLLLKTQLKRATNSSNQSPLDKLTALGKLNDSVVWFPYNMSYRELSVTRRSRPIFETVLRQTKVDRHDMTYRVAYSPAPVWPQFMTSVCQVITVEIRLMKKKNNFNKGTPTNKFSKYIVNVDIIFNDCYWHQIDFLILHSGN
ncbi:uncharacterized protein [Ptychodera flava]|uniref:uncharacterized protein isoform X2 n=1 Tax=Ptychodera flava TaxID=63121 RepID=UPI003969D285